MRVRSALDVLLIEDAVWHASSADMSAAADDGDGIALLRANCARHARIAVISPNAMLNSIYLGLLDVIEEHTLAVVPMTDQPLLDSLYQRYRMHVRLVDVIVVQDPARALQLIAQHNATVD